MNDELMAIVADEAQNFQSRLALIGIQCKCWAKGLHVMLEVCRIDGVCRVYSMTLHPEIGLTPAYHLRKMIQSTIIQELAHKMIVGE
jgi:hypothetical protein